MACHEQQCFGNEWGDSPIMFMGVAITNENYCRITLSVTKNSLYIASHISFYFLHAVIFTRTQEKFMETPINHLPHFVVYGGLIDYGIMMLYKHIYLDQLSSQLF